MLNKIIKFSLHNRPFIIVMSLLLIIVGCWTAWKMDVDVFPDLNAPTVVIMTEANGMAPEEVERLVTFPIETAVNGATDVRRVRSSSTTGFSVVWVEFDWGTDIYRDRQIISEKISSIENDLPNGVGRPTMGPQSSIMGEVMFIGLTADTTSLGSLRTLADWTIRPRLLSTGGVAQVTVMGGDIMEYQIALRPERMRHYGVSLNDVAEATKNMNQNVSGGIHYEHGNEYIIRGVVSTNRIAELSKATIKLNNVGKPIVLSDIANVKMGSKSPKTGVASVSGKPAVLLTITKQPTTSTLELTEKLDTTIAALKSALPKDVKINTHLYRQKDFIDSSISNIKKSLIEGGVFVVLVLCIFLMNARTTLISLVTIPLSLLISILVLRFMGLNINTMSIGGMAIAIGSLVDDAIVDVENVFKRLHENGLKPTTERLRKREVIFNASKEVRMPILNSTLIIIVSFLPLFFLSGLEGKMLVPLGISFITSLFASTLVALTLTPVLCSYLLTEGKLYTPDTKQFRLHEPKLVRWLKHHYAKWLLWATGKASKWILASTATLVIITLIVFFTLGRSFLPPFNEGSFTINISSLPGISLDESNHIGNEAEKLLLQVPEVKDVARKTGRAELDEHALGINTSELEVPFVLNKRSKDEVANDIRQKLSKLQGVNIEIGQPISHRIDAMLSGTKASIAIKVFGPDLTQLHAIGMQIKQATQNIEGVADLNVEQQIERPQIVIKPRRNMLAAYGISLAEFTDFISTTMGGKVVSQVQNGNKQYDLTLRLESNEMATIDKIKSVLINTAEGKQVPLYNVADIISTAGPNTINRENAERKLVVSANANGRDIRSVVNDMKQNITQKVKLPTDYHIEYGGQFESEASASRLLLGLSVVSIGIILLLLFMQFKSWRQAVVVLLNLPLALIGGVFAIFCTSGVVSIPAIIGFISLFGMATRGGMLLVDRYNELSLQGFTKKKIIMKGSLDRLLPILMTALCSALALIPLAIGSDLSGNEIQSPMAKVMLGGLLTSTLLNLFIVPIMAPLKTKGK